MPRENVLTTTAARLARIPFWLLARRPFVPPQKALILQPCCLSQVMLTTPLLAALSRAFPRARFDWAVSDWARPAVAGNPRLTELISTGSGRLGEGGWREIRALVQQLRQEEYDTCFIPGRSALLSLVAWQAGIPQRVGLNVDGRGFAHTIAVPLPAGERHTAAIYLAIAAAAGIDTRTGGLPPMEFYPSDAARTAVTKRLIDELDWLGDAPLVIMHPGGGANPVQTDRRKQWPAERFVLLGNHLVRKYQARVLLVGGKADRPLAEAIAGMMPAPVVSWAGRISLGEIGALGEVADLYVGNDTGPTHVAAAAGCRTLAIFGPTDPAVSAPYGNRDQVITLWREWHEAEGQSFSWDNGVSVAEAIKAADTLLKPVLERKASHPPGG
ncbi:MAG TPA: glycosyltransferase family 9 protein [Anaerolineae bacterium]